MPARSALRRLAAALLEGARRRWLELRAATARPDHERQRLADFLRASVDFVWETDAELRLVYLSEPAAAILGRPIASLIGQRWTDLACEPANRIAEPAELLGVGDDRDAPEPGQAFRDRRCSVLGADGRLRTLETSGVPLVDRAGRLLGHRGTAREVSDRAGLERRLRFLAGHDPLTGAANRALLEAAVARTIEQAADAGRSVALVTIDLDGFKAVNDAFGHGAGDAVLRTVVRRLRESAGERDLVARLGGDEFAVLVAELEGAAALRPRLDAIERRLAEPVPVDGVAVTLGASCGSALWPEAGPDLAELLRRADADMYRAKQARREAAQDERWRADGAAAPG